MRTDWGSLPDTIIDRKLGEATTHPRYISAKSGNIEDAYYLAKDLVSGEAVQKLKQLIGDKEVVLAPVHAEEAMGRNMIPIAVSTVIAKALNLKVDLNIVQSVKVSRTKTNGWYRLANAPSFDGNITGGKYVIMIDDTQTQGGTFAAFKGHIERHGTHKVLASYALTGKQYSVQLRLDPKTLQILRGKYANLEPWWQETFGYDFSKLTEWEARFVINSGKTVDEVRDKIIASKQS